MEESTVTVELLARMIREWCGQEKRQEQKDTADPDAGKESGDCRYTQPDPQENEQEITSGQLSEDLIDRICEEFKEQLSEHLSDEIREELRKQLCQDFEKTLKQEKDEIAKQRRLLEKEQREFDRSREFEKKRNEQEKQLFDMKWHMLEDEWRKLAAERERIEHRRSFYARLEEFERQGQEKQNTIESCSLLYVGVTDHASLKKRYRDLLKIYHPDNQSGDKEMVQRISDEFENLKKRFEE